MKLLVDPHHWFEGDFDDSAVKAPDGTKGRLLDNAPRPTIQALRDDLDRGTTPEEELVVRDLKSFKKEWPSVVARLPASKVTSPDERYPAYQRAINSVTETVLFQDLRRIDEYIEAPEGVPSEIKTEALTLALKLRKREPAIPTPEFYDTYPELASNLLGLQNKSEVAFASYILDLQTIKEALNDPQTYDNPRIKAWIERFGWVSDDKPTEMGKFVVQYLSADPETQRQFKMVAIIAAAKTSVSQLMVSKLDKALDTIDVDLPADIQGTVLDEVLRYRSDESVYADIHEILEQEDLDRFTENINVDSADEVRKLVAESRARDLEEILKDLKLVPVELYAVDTPPELQSLVEALDPHVLETHLDTAVGDDRATLDESLRHLESLATELGPIIPPHQREQLADLLNRIEDLREGLHIETPDSAVECHDLYDRLISQRLSHEFTFAQTEDRQRESILAACEDYIREQYEEWITQDSRHDRDITMLVDAPDIVDELYDDYDHVVVMISDGFGLRQWMEGSRKSPKYQHWEDNYAVTNELATTIFPSETGAGHYSFLTGLFPGNHGRDDIQKSIPKPEDHIFARAADRGAHTKALSYLGNHGEGFSAVLGDLADEFEELSDFRSSAASLSRKSQQAISSHVRAHDRTLSVIQHNQIDQIHESGDHIAEALLAGVTSNIVDYIEALSEALTEDVCFLLTADHGMLRLDDDGLLNVTDYQVRNDLKERGYETTVLGQRVVGLKQTPGGHQAWGDQETGDYEILNESKVEQLRAKTNDKCSGPILRMKRRKYSHDDTLTATHGGFTFDEMFIPMLTFDLQKIAELDAV